MLYQVAQLILLRIAMIKLLEVVEGLYKSIMAFFTFSHLDNSFQMHGMSLNPVKYVHMLKSTKASYWHHLSTATSADISV